MPAEAALHDRILRHQAELVRFFARRAPDRAEELAQETWLRVARAEPNCPSEAHFRGYVYAVARRLLIDHHRRRKARVHLVPLEGGAERRAGTDAATPFRHVAAGEVLAVVEATLGGMKPELAEVFRWRTAEEVPFKEIARRQGTGVNTALGRMHQAVKKIRDALEAADLLQELP